MSFRNSPLQVSLRILLHRKSALERLAQAGQDLAVQTAVVSGCLCLEHSLEIGGNAHGRRGDLVAVRQVHVLWIHYESTVCGLQVDSLKRFHMESTIGRK